jgi:hypothetical protein
MSKFYVLPSRPLLGEHFAGYLKTLFPGLEWRSQDWSELGDALATLAASQPEVYVVYRQELPEGEDPSAALCDGFGAVAGDEVIEVALGEGAGVPTSRRWRIGGPPGEHAGGRAAA